MPMAFPQLNLRWIISVLAVAVAAAGIGFLIGLWLGS
jgi:hypothetical protein